MYKFSYTTLLGIFCALALTSLTACNKSSNQYTSTQSVAKVDDAEITMHQINQMMKGAQNVSAENVDATRHQILEKLIDQQVIIEKAKKENLDRSPEIISAIESAKKEILATAYLEKLVANNSKVTDSEIKQYYLEHPALFSKRRVYNLQDIGSAKNANTYTILNEEVAKQKSMLEIVDILKAKNIEYSAGVYTRSAEQLPLNILPKLENLKVGETVVLEASNTIHVMMLAGAEEAPIDVATATPFIRSYFTNTRAKKIVADKIKQFRKEAKIEYLGAFAAKANKIEAITNPKPNVVEPDTQPREKENSAKDSSIEAGIAGLK